jgi:hypothetical protein
VLCGVTNVLPADSNLAFKDVMGFLSFINEARISHNSRLLRNKLHFLCNFERMSLHAISCGANWRFGQCCLIALNRCSL